MKKNTTLLTLYILSCLGFGALSWILLSYGLLPIRYRWILVGVLFAIQLIAGVFTLKIKRGKASKALLSLFLVLLLCFYAGGSYYIKRGVDTLSLLSQKKNEEIQFSLVVLKDSPIQYWEDLEKESIAAPLEKDKENLDLFLKETKEKTSRELQLKKVESYSQGAQELLHKKAKVLLLNESYRKLIEDQVKDFSESTRVIDLTKLKLGKVEVIKKDISKKVKKQESFNLYISGIDSFGDIHSTVSRSDVNLILSINPNTHKILITTIPRDSYLPIAGGGNEQYDKLTHAGIYGIESSVKTLENLLNIDINYYARVNFSTLITLVDVLGGVDVENDQEFTSLHGKFYFPVGKVHLNGEKALGFSRERFALSGGDYDRGRNQSKVLSAMIEKALSPSILLNYNKFLRIVSDSAETNMPREKIIDLVNEQLEHRGKWSISTVDIKGNGASGLHSYAMPNHNLYMVLLDEGSLEEIKRQIYGIKEQ